VIVSFSNRQFYSKAVQAWRDGTGYSRTLLVKSYFLAVAGFTEPEAVTEVILPGSPLPDAHVDLFVCSFLLVASWPRLLSSLSACAAKSVCMHAGVCVCVGGGAGERDVRVCVRAYVHVQACA
jgi:hypothetical protein